MVDSTAHVMLHCPAHNVPRRVMTAAVGAALSTPTANAHITSLGAAGTDTRRVQLLLGSPPPLTIGASNTHYTAVLRASANFIRGVYTARWPLAASAR